MLFKKYIDEGTMGEVSFANGTVKFKSFQLNVYSFIYDGIAIDAGSQSLAKQFQPYYERQSIDSLYCTHIHEDHTGSAAWMQKRNIPIYLNELTIQEAKKEGKYPLYRQLFWGKRQPFDAKSIPKTFTSRKYEWESIFTPGHSKDHTVFLNKSTGQLFSGDLFVQVQTKVIMDSESIPTIIRSIEKVLSYDFEEIFCNHAGYVENGKQKLKAKLSYLQQLTEEIQHLHTEGRDLNEIQQQIFPRKYPIIKYSFGQWDSKHIITSILE